MVAPASRIGVEPVDATLAILSLEGEHDLNEAADLRAAVDGLIARGSAVVVDLAAATFVDSSVLAELLNGRERCADRGLGFAISLPGGSADAVRRVIEVTGLADAVAVRGDREAAVEAAREAATA